MGSNWLNRLSLTRSSLFLIAPLAFFAVLFLITTIIFVAFYANGRGKVKSLPKWPPPSPSHLGTYSTAAVAADNVICSGVGRNTLLMGGNAVDAAIATMFCLGVMDTHSCGLGGGFFMTIYNATLKQCQVIDARETASMNASEKMFVDRWDKSSLGWEAIAVPGELHGLWTAFTHFGSGRVQWRELVHPTIKLIREGYPASLALAGAIEGRKQFLLNEPTMARRFVNPNTGRLYRAGEQIKTRQTLGDTLEKLAQAENPVELFYRGELAELMAKEFHQNGGLLSREDFANYHSIIHSSDSDIIYTKLSKGKSICGPPPPSGSAVTQAILNILDQYTFDTNSFPGTVDFLHKYLEASKFAFGQRELLGDAFFVKKSMEIAKNITSEQWGSTVRSKIKWNTQPTSYYAEKLITPTDDHGTSHVSIIDSQGNAVSVTSSINIWFGAKVMSDSTGIVWNNQMDDFSTPRSDANYWGFMPSPANFICPGKRPMSSMSPIIIFNRDNDWDLLAIGASGGSRIISGVSNAAFHAGWLGLSLKEAIDFPRLHNQLGPLRITRLDSLGTVPPDSYLNALRERGHTFASDTEMSVVIAVQRVQNGTVFANSDWRKGWESEPAGY